MNQSQSIADSRNFGPKSTKWLESVGVYNIDDLKKWDMFNLFFVLKDEGYPVNRNFLYAIYGAINYIDWRNIPEDVKKDIQLKLGL